MAKSASEKNKKIILIVLFLAAVALGVYNLFFSGPPPRPKLKADNSANQNSSSRQQATSAPSAPRAGNTVQQRERDYQNMLADRAPLDLAVLASSPGSANISPRGNIFAFYVPPPPPPPKPIPPPPIALQMVQPPNAVSGTPKTVTLTVVGQGYPPDAVIILDGREKPTKRVNDTALSTEIAAGEYSTPRNMNIEVKSKSDPAKLFSNTIPFIVQPAPEPPFKYIGRIGEQGLFEMSGTKEINRKKRGETLQGVWRIEAITDTAVEVIHAQLEIKKRVPMQDKGR